MKVSLKGLPDALRRGAWPSSARAVRCPVKSGNEQDPYPYLPARPFGDVRTIRRLPPKGGGGRGQR